jgi:hypothetical protein
MITRHHPLHVSLLLAGFFFATAPIGWAQPYDPMITAGTRTMNVGGMIDDDGNDLGLELNVSRGWFVADYLELGGRLGVGFRGSDSSNLSIGGYAERHFETRYYWVPYVGAAAQLSYLERGNYDETYLELEGYGGSRYFFAPHAAVGGELALKFATEDVYNRFEDAFDWVIRLKTSWYF